MTERSQCRRCFQGMMRRGLTYEALRQFIIAQGASKNYNLMDWDKIWSFNKKVIDPVCPRHTGVIEKKKIPFYLSNGPEKPEMRVMPKHKKNPSTGNKITTYSKSVWVESTDALVFPSHTEPSLYIFNPKIKE